MSRTEDTDFMRDLRAAYIRPPRTSASLLLISIIIFFIWAVFWSRDATLDEVTNGLGQVIPSGDVQVIQNLEGGIVSEIMVRQGDIVKEGQVLVVIDDTQFRSSLLEDRARHHGYMAAAARLKAEIDESDPVFPKEVIDEYPDLVKGEIALFKSHNEELRSSLAVLRDQLDQKKQEVVELRGRIDQLTESYNLALEELAIVEPLVKSRATSRMELIRLKREISDIEGKLKAAKQAEPRILSALSEAERRIEEQRAVSKSKSLAELNDAKVNMAALSGTLTSAKDRLSRTEVRSPANGTVKQIHVNTVGGVVRPGMDLVEIVPLEDNLLVEARIRPSDIAFLHPGQEVKVKITAYDYTIYGSLDAKLEQISADSITDEEGESFYEIRVRTDRNFLTRGDERLPIIPGMIAEVDVLTGKKTVFDYLMKPILRAQQKALRER